MPRVESMEHTHPESARENETPRQTESVDTSWTVYGPDVSRGNLIMETAPNDPRMAVGWKANPFAPFRLPGDMSWATSTTQQQSGAHHTERDAEGAPGLSYPHPELLLPHPGLSLDFRMSVSLSSRISVGPTPHGHRNWISFTGGTWSASWGSGIVVPGGQDNQVVLPNGSARVETTYLLQTHDNPPAHIVIKTRGWRTGPPDVLAQLNDPQAADKVNPGSYKFRLFIEMETGDERYRDRVNSGMWVGSGARKCAEVVYE